MDTKRQIKVLFYVTIFGLFLVAVLPKYDQLVLGVKETKNASLIWLVAAGISFALTYISSALVYKILAMHRLSTIKTIFAQVACSFTNRLLPGGFGGVSLNIDYLIKNKHQPAEASAVVAMNSLVALISHMLLFVIAVAISQKSIAQLFGSRSYFIWIILAIFVVAGLAIVIIYKNPKLNKKLTKFVRDAWKSFVSYRKSLDNLLLAIGVASVTTFLFVFSLYACANSLGMPINLLQVFLVYTIGVTLGAVIATPGGLGSYEAGLYAGLIYFHDVPSLVFSVIILFRLIIFWLPIIPGYIAFVTLRKAKII